MTRTKLTSGDVEALNAVLDVVARADRGDARRDRQFLCALGTMERALPPGAGIAFREWSSDDLRSEIARWRPAYRIVRTRAGFKAFRWIGRRGEYARRATVAGLAECDVGPYRALVRR